MKKPVTAVMMVIFALMFGSCKRDYMCACTHGGGRPIFKFDLEAKKKKDAKAQCQAKKEQMGDKYTCEMYYSSW